jgi:mannosyltransferase OCH1-like enzyme
MNIYLILLIIIIILLLILIYLNNNKKKVDKFILNNINLIPISVIILNYKRPNNISKLVENLDKIKYIDEIIISHGDKNTEIIINNPKIINETILRNKYYSATRFELATLAKNDLILYLDDDLYPSNNLIENLLIKYYNDDFEGNQNLYGSFPRKCDDNYNNYSYLDYNIILTGLALVNKQRSIKIWNKIKESEFLNILMKNKGNGEDILFSKFNYLMGGENIYVTGKYYDLDVSNGYSSNDDHYKVRSELCKKINNYNFGQIIEKNIVQTNYHNIIEDLPLEYINNIKKIKEQNPDYTYYYFNNNDCIKFIKENYDNEIAYLYENINDCYGAAKADFFRLLFIYKMGGVYLDIKSTLAKPLNEIIRPFDEYLLSSWKTKNFHYIHQNEYSGYHINNNKFGEFTQWNIIARKNHPFLKTVIDKIIYNLKNPPNKTLNVLNILQLTGPIIYTNTILEIINNYNYTFKYNCFNNNLIYTIYFSNYIHRHLQNKNINYRYCNQYLMKYQK